MVFALNIKPEDIPGWSTLDLPSIPQCPARPRRHRPALDEIEEEDATFDRPGTASLFDSSDESSGEKEGR